MQEKLNSPSKIHFIAIGLFAFSMIAIQILATRIFSVVFYYHFAFAGITLAMLGLTVCAFKVYYKPSRFTSSTVDEECGKHALYSAISIVIATLGMVDIAGRLTTLADSYTGSLAETIRIFGGLLLISGPFFLCSSFVAIGVCVTLLLTYFPSHTSRLYAVDLVSAALGCILMIVMLKFFDPVSVILLLASLLSIFGWKLAKEKLSSFKVKMFYSVIILFFSLFTVQSYSYVTGNPIFHLRIAKLSILEKFDFERWNSFTHVGVYQTQNSRPFEWGFSEKFDEKNHELIEQKKLVIDGSAGTILTKFDGDLDKVNFLKYDVINSGYHLRDINHTAIIGVGGGRDVLSALVFGVRKITGIEINPSIFEALNKVYADFTGKLYSYEEIEMVNAEARSYISSHDVSYDMIQISLIDTWAATAAGGLALSENKLYTKEAWVDFFKHLNENGMLSVSRWFMADKHHGELYRLLSLATDSLKEIAPDADIRNHVIVLNNYGGIINMLISKSAFTPDEIAKTAEFAETYGFNMLITPTKDFDDISKTILSGNASKTFYDSLPLDVTTTTDDRPFFFNMTRFRNIFSPLEGEDNAANNAATYVLATLAAIVFSYLTYAVIWPMFNLYRAKRQEFKNAQPYIAYFTLIGLGFMFIEMSLMQWLTIFLGHPVYGLSVILFTLLLFSGIGSYTVRSHNLSRSAYIIRPLLLCISIATTLWLVHNYRMELHHHNTEMRILFSVLLLIPVSLFLGMMFPLGVAAAKKQHAELLPWFWALNGAASVFASIFSVIISMSYGASISYCFGLLCYILCFFICLHLSRKF